MKPQMLSPVFTDKVIKIKALLAEGDVKAAMAMLDEAWNIVGSDKPARKVAHDLGNVIQRVIFEQYESAEGVAQ